MSGFHADEVAAQARAGRVLGDLPALRSAMPDQHRAFFAGLPYLLVGTPDAASAPLATLLAGQPGFVQSPDPTHLRIAKNLDPEDPATPHLVPGAEIGILGIDLSSRRRNRANGRIAARDADGLEIAVAQSFGNCPQYIQRRTAEPIARRPGPTETLSGLDERARALIGAADTLFVASRSRAGLAAGGTDISHRGGRPGFVRVAGDRLSVPDFSGNRYFNTLGNLLGEPRAALLFVDFQTGDLLVLQGTTEIDWSGAEAAGFEGAQRSWRFHATGGWRRSGALPLRWSDPEPAPQIARTGRWDDPARAA